MLFSAWISRIDICFDLPRLSQDVVVFRFKSTRKRLVVRTEGKESTDYKVEGSRRRNRLKSYQKGEQTRFEFEFYPGSKQLKLGDVLDYEFPFKRFELYDPQFLLELGIHPYTIHVIDMLGINKALKVLNCAKERRVLKRALKKYLLCSDAQQFQKISRKKIKTFMNKTFKG